MRSVYWPVTHFIGTENTDPRLTGNKSESRVELEKNGVEKKRFKQKITNGTGVT